MEFSDVQVPRFELRVESPPVPTSSDVEINDSDVETTSRSVEGIDESFPCGLNGDGEVRTVEVEYINEGRMLESVSNDAPFVPEEVTTSDEIGSSEEVI